MRIMMLSHGYPPTVSGVTLVVQKIAQAMVKRGHSVTVITASERGKPYRDEDEGVQLVRCRSLPNLFWKEGPIPAIGLRTLREEIQRVQPDLIHTHENAILSNQLLRLRNEIRVPLVSSCYYLPRYVTHYLQGGSKVKDWIENLIWKYAISNLNHFDQIIFCTRTHERAFVQSGLRIPTTVISNGVNTSRYSPGWEGLADGIDGRYNLPPQPRILFVGRLAKDKQIDILIQAMSHVLARREAHLIIVGRGDDRPRLKELIKSSGLEAYVHLLGFVPEEDLPALYRACDLFAIASVCEVQSIPALQATVTGLPVVAANAAALPELVHDKVNGYLVPPFDIPAMSNAILQILDSPESSTRMGKASLRIGLAHSEIETFRAYEHFYLSMVTAERTSLAVSQGYPIT